MDLWLVFVVTITILGGLSLCEAPPRVFGGCVHLERAREMFWAATRAAGGTIHPGRCRFGQATRPALAGLPRGQRPFNLVRDRHTGHYAALAAVTIQFEAVEGSDMEGLPAVDNLRNASGVFFFQAGEWSTVGRAIFNMNPDEAAAHFSNQYEKIM